jgi:hypothetical protein
MFDSQMRDFSNELDIDQSEGQTLIANNYGYNYYEACFECIDEIKADIAQQRADEEYNWEMERYYWEQSHGRHNK